MREELEAQFTSAFPKEQFYLLHEDLESLPNGSRSIFILEKLLTGLDIYTWNMSISTLPGGKRFSTGIVSIDQLVVAAVFTQLAGDSWVRNYYLPRTNRDLYNSFSEGYYNSNVAPGGVGAVYDELGAYYDTVRARSACPELARRAVVGNQAGAKNGS